MKRGLIILFNDGYFEITEVQDGRITKIKRLIEPRIEVETEQRGKALKLLGWKNYKEYKTITQKQAQQTLANIRRHFDLP